MDGISDIQLSEYGKDIRVHSVETFGTHDGPGIRLVIFVQGCQFRCLYCQNPDTLDLKGGTEYKIQELVKKAVRQKDFFGHNGGVTVSGGEPLLQRHSLVPFFKELHYHGIHTCLDSNGRVLDTDAKALLEETDLLLLDVKHINNDWHKKLTGVENINPLKIAAYREETQKPMWLRYVLVPGWSDQEEYLHEWAQHFKDYKMVEKVEIIPFHQLGKHKWEMLNMKYELSDTESPSEELLQKTQAIFSSYLNNVQIK